MERKPRMIAVAGTNASGKSSLGISLAAHFGGEVISADSRQVYRGLDLGSGKITQEEMQGVPHYMLGFSLGSFLLREYLTKYPSEGELAGAIIAGTGHQPGWLLSVMMGAAACLSEEEFLSALEKDFVVEKQGSAIYLTWP